MRSVGGHIDCEITAFFLNVQGKCRKKSLQAMNFPLKVASNVEITNIFCPQRYLYRFNSFKQYMVNSLSKK